MNIHWQRWASVSLICFFLRSPLWCVRKWDLQHLHPRHCQMWIAEFSFSRLLSLICTTSNKWAHCGRNHRRGRPIPRSQFQLCTSPVHVECFDFKDHSGIRPLCSNNEMRAKAPSKHPWRPLTARSHAFLQSRLTRKFSFLSLGLAQPW